MITARNLEKVVAILMAVVIAAVCLVMVSPAAKKVSATGVDYPYASVLGQGNILDLSIQIEESEWLNLLENPLEEEYTICNITLDGVSVGNVGIRTKGNTSLSQVASTDSDRFSFKLEFDHYVSGQTWLGLDKLCLNNNVYDATLMKEYLTYNWMQQLGVDTPLCSYIKVSVNGEYWGLYLGVEAIEESYVTRCYGTDYGNLYKPETMEMGGGDIQVNDDGNKMRPDDFAGQKPFDDIQNEIGPDDNNLPANPDEQEQSPPDMHNEAEVGNSDLPAIPDGQEQSPPDMQIGTDSGRTGMRNPGGIGRQQNSGGADLVYTDDNPENYRALFDSAVFDISEADENRLIAALKELNEGTDPSIVVEAEKTLAYFAVSVFTVNLDSYLSNMTHNYYLYEKDGVLTMLPWDFNLSFAGFQSGNAESAVNYPIDTPLSGVSEEERPILMKLLNTEAGLSYYHSCLTKLAENALNGTFSQQIQSLYNQLAELAETDPTAFYDIDEVEAAVQTLEEFVQLRGESVMGQLNGTVPSTEEEQQQNPDLLIDASTVNLQTMGSQGGDMGGNKNREPDFSASPASDTAESAPEIEKIPEFREENPFSDVQDFSAIQKAIEIVGNTDLSELSDEQKEQLDALGVDLEMLEQFKNEMQVQPRQSNPYAGSIHVNSDITLSVMGIMVLTAAFLFVVLFKKHNLKKH